MASQGSVGKAVSGRFEISDSLAVGVAIYNPWSPVMAATMLSGYVGIAREYSR